MTVIYHILLVPKLVCRNIRERIYLKKISFGKSNYSLGKKYCRRCEVYIYYNQGMFCPCCGMQLRITHHLASFLKIIEVECQPKPSLSTAVLNAIISLSNLSGLIVYQSRIYLQQSVFYNIPSVCSLSNSGVRYISNSFSPSIISKFIPRRIESIFLSSLAVYIAAPDMPNSL